MSIGNSHELRIVLNIFTNSDCKKYISSQQKIYIKILNLTRLPHVSMLKEFYPDSHPIPSLSPSNLCGSGCNTVNLF